MYAIIASFMIATIAQASMPSTVAKKKLERILTCEMATSPKEVVSLIERLGGVSIIKNASLLDAEYTIPNPLDIFGNLVTSVSIRQGINDDIKVIEYNSIIPNASIEIETLANIADIDLDMTGTYRREVGKNDLVLRSEVGVIHITCMNNVRSFKKDILRFIGW